MQIQYILSHAVQKRLSPYNDLQMISANTKRLHMNEIQYGRDGVEKCCVLTELSLGRVCVFIKVL